MRAHTRVGVAGFLMGTSLAIAGVSGSLLTVRVGVEGGAAGYEVPMTETGWTIDDLERGSTWSLASPVTLRDPRTGQILARLQDATAYLRGDPEVCVQVSILAGDQPIDVEITSAKLDFASIECAMGHATAAATLSDNNGDGAELEARSGHDGNALVWAAYNGEVPACSTYAGLIRSFAVDSGSRVTSRSENAPAQGASSFFEPVNNMMLVSGFHLSAHDSVTLSAQFEIWESAVLTGDANCDQFVDFDDVDGFIMLLSDGDNYRERFPECCGTGAGDINRDGVVDFADIDGFVQCITNGGCE